MAKIKLLLSFIFSCLLAGLAATTASAQAPKPVDPLMKIYRETAPKINDLVHTRLAVSFDYKKCYLYGKEWLTLKPHFYPTDTLRLDAKGMALKNISLVKNGKNMPLKFTYDSLTIAIHLDKVYEKDERYTLYIDYTAKPNELKLSANAAITGAKGLYFINPDSAEKGKPVQIWTQGETEGSSAWFPTIDNPDQKTTSEISMTVPAKYVTLSNGRLASQKNNKNQTRTDTWIMDLPHSPYLFMMAVGDFKIYHDHWREKEVNYYLEAAYAPYAKEIFHDTPDMIEFYSKTLGVDFPWNKYSQIVVRDYVSGAMENTTATLHGAYVQETHRDLIDAYYDAGRTTIAHELFHQWFGDYVTAESWSNLTLNESFADFSETLWAEHRYGQDAGDDHSHGAMLTYLSQPDDAAKNLVRFHYADDGDVFDNVTYQKGGRILNMLRNYLGREAFYKGLNLYLKTNALKNAEAHNLRLAMEEVSGRDLNWFFNQWYYGAGHPVLDIRYKWDDACKTETVYIAQKQDGQIFKLPMAIDIYADGKKERHNVWANNKADTLSFKVDAKPDLVNVDGDKILLAVKNDAKTQNEYVFQFYNAPLYMDRYEAIEGVQENQSEAGAQKVLLAALKDKYYGLRLKAIKTLDLKNDAVYRAALPLLTSLAQTDENTLVRAAALTSLAKLKLPADIGLFRQNINSQSYAIQAAALNGIDLLDRAEGAKFARQLQTEDNPRLLKIIAGIYAEDESCTNWPFVYKVFSENKHNAQFIILKEFAVMTGKVSDPAESQKGIEELKKHAVTFQQGAFIAGWLKKIKDQRLQLKDNATAKSADDAIKAINDSK